MGQPLIMDRTDNLLVNNILDSIEGAASSYHNVNYWNEEEDWMDDGTSCLDRINICIAEFNAANSTVKG